MRILWLPLLLLSAPALAEPITLPAAMRAAVAERPLATAARARAEAAEQGASEATNRYWPRLAFSETYTTTDEPAGSLFLALNQERNVMADPAYDLVDPNRQSDFETRLSLEQTLFDPDRYYHRTLARLNAEAARAASRWNEDEAALAALQAYLEVQRAEAADSWVQSSQREAEEILHLACERRAAGLGLKADELRARVFLTEVQRRGLASRNDVTIARRRLALAVGRAGSSVEIAAPLTIATFPTPPGEDQVEGRADLQALAQRSEASAAKVRQARADWLPRAGVQASYAWHDETAPFGADGSGWGVRAALNWELFDGFRRQAASGRAAAELQATRAEQSEAVNQSRIRLEEARLRSEEARLQLDLAQKALLEADESCRLLQQRYQTGLTDLADLLAAQSALDRARFDAMGAETSLLASLARVYFEQGQLLQTFVARLEEKTP